MSWGFCVCLLGPGKLSLLTPIMPTMEGYRLWGTHTEWVGSQLVKAGLKCPFRLSGVGGGGAAIHMESLTSWHTPKPIGNFMWNLDYQASPYQRPLPRVHRSVSPSSVGNGYISWAGGGWPSQGTAIVTSRKAASWSLCSHCSVFCLQILTPQVHPRTEEDQNSSWIMSILNICTHQGQGSSWDISFCPFSSTS